jgi:uncharacterized protein YjlB
MDILVLSFDHGLYVNIGPAVRSRRARMVDVEDIKKIVEAATGITTPTNGELDGLLRDAKASAFHFKDDGFIPNHPLWPLLLYPACVRLPKGRDPAAIFEALFARNDWGRSWRNGAYDFVHYHSRTHEVLAVARGWVRLQLGGPKGRILPTKAGDVAILPAGTGHQRLAASDNFLAVGAYPPGGAYDEYKNVERHTRAKITIRKTARLKRDPIYGAESPLLKHWKKRAA